MKYKYYNQASPGSMVPLTGPVMNSLTFCRHVGGKSLATMDGELRFVATTVPRGEINRYLGAAIRGCF